LQENPCGIDRSYSAPLHCRYHGFWRCPVIYPVPLIAPVNQSIQTSCIPSDGKVIGRMNSALQRLTGQGDLLAFNGNTGRWPNEFGDAAPIQPRDFAQAPCL